MGKSYTVVFNSLISGNSVVGETFNYDWGQLPNVPYKVTFSFVSTVATLVNNIIPVIFLDLGQQSSILATTTGTTGLKNKLLGCLFYSGTGAGSYLYADTHTNPPIYLNGRPTNNNVFIELHTNSASAGTNYPIDTIEYVLTLNLEEQ